MIRSLELTKRYRRKEALLGLTLDVPEGSVFALIGPNGAGKSTAIRTIMNIVQPTSGSAEVLGTDSRRLGPAELARIGYFSENQKLPEWMTVRQLLAYLAPFYPDWRNDDSAALVKSFDLPPERRLRDLSRGMKVKAALAASLAYRPRLLVLDEPFGGLDVLVREQLIETILERTPETTVFLASHDLGEIESFATHIAYLNDGKLQFVEEMSQLVDRFREVEVTLEEPAELPSGLPPSWLNPQAAGVVVRFADSAFDAACSRQEIASRFRGVREVAARSMTLRAMVVALAKSAGRAS